MTVRGLFFGLALIIVALVVIHARHGDPLGWLVILLMAVAAVFGVAFGIGLVIFAALSGIGNGE